MSTSFGVQKLLYAVGRKQEQYGVQKELYSSDLPYEVNDCISLHSRSTVGDNRRERKGKVGMVVLLTGTVYSRDLLRM